MTTEAKNVIVCKDQAGEYFLLPQGTLEQYRVPEEHKAEVQRLLSEAGGDVSGYLVSTTDTLFRVINIGAKALGDFVADAALINWIEQQMYSGGKA